MIGGTQNSFKNQKLFIITFTKIGIEFDIKQCKQKMFLLFPTFPQNP